MSNLQVGQAVPNFELDVYLPTQGEFGKMSLQELKNQGKWTILVFYPADFTFVCATEFSALAERYEAFEEMGAEVITVSTDTVYTHLAWQQEEGSLRHVKYAMGADRNATVSKLFGVYNEASGNDLRGTFVISPNGILTNAEVNFYNLGRNMDELLRKLEANVYLAEHGAEACPAQWKAGDKTLHPGAGLVGKVYEALNG